jgi:DNA polymerase/3'-5' exonuclease PolX
MADDVPKFPRSLVFDVYLELARRFDPAPAWIWDGCEETKPQICPHALADRICAVGGFRRRKTEMKDLEILYIPRIAKLADGSDLFGAEHEVDVTERLIEELRATGVICQRMNKDGHVSSWGPWNKHAVHMATGLPLDLFAATRESWFNRLAVTTGPKSLNVLVASAARKLGFEWEVNSPGFVPLGGTWDACPKMRRTMRSEREVFEFVNFPYLPPEDRL